MATTASPSNVTGIEKERNKKGPRSYLSLENIPNYSM